MLHADHHVEGQDSIETASSYQTTSGTAITRIGREAVRGYSAGTLTLARIGTWRGMYSATAATSAEMPVKTASP